MKVYTITFTNDKGEKVLTIVKPFKSVLKAICFIRAELNKPFTKFADGNIIN